MASRLFTRVGKGLDGGSLAALTHGDVRGAHATPPMPASTNIHDDDSGGGCQGGG